MNREWYIGPPPHVGWWNASTVRDAYAWRWWDGKWWGYVTYPEDTREEVLLCAKRMEARFGIVWTHYWPSGARVPRINPETGEVTGGSL